MNNVSWAIGRGVGKGVVECGRCGKVCWGVGKCGG